MKNKTKIKEILPDRINFYNEHPDLLEQRPIVDTEIEVCELCTDKEGNKFYERYEGNGKPIWPYVWTVYIRTAQTFPDGAPFNPVCAIADFATEERAQEFEKLIRSLLKLK